jgi:hypothetical protein
MVASIDLIAVVVVVVVVVIGVVEDAAAVALVVVLARTAALLLALTLMTKPPSLHLLEHPLHLSVKAEKKLFFIGLRDL